MVSILLSWIIIFIYTYAYGRAGIKLLYGKAENLLRTWDVYVVCGMMILTVYAQFLSLFFRVGLAAFIIVSIGAVLCILYLVSTDSAGGSKVEADRSKLRNAIVLVGTFGILLWTNIVPQHYDTYLYHAQAIRWIEEYGVVPGLANLHFRFAYNSAFLSLQALFSFVWVNGRSLHTVNGFIVVFMLGYAVTSFRQNRKKEIQTSSLLKLGMLAYFFYISVHISSPNTDIPSLLLLFYICIKWSEFAERKTSALPYGFLCLLCVYAATIKLSTAIFVILTVYPAWDLIQHKQWKQIRNHIIVGILVVLPYLVRNVIISGFLIYPYPEIDFFNVDWKMSKQTAYTDRQEIIAWARGNQDIGRYQESINEWFSEWFMSIHVLWRILFVIAIITAMVLLTIIVRDIIQHKNRPEDTLGVVSIIGVIFWLLSAPLPRYGVVYMMFVPCITIGMSTHNDILRKYVENKIYVRLNKAIDIGLMCVVVLYGVCYFLYGHFAQCGTQTLFVQNDYQDYDIIEEGIDGIIISGAVEGDQTGYRPFPAIPYSGVIKSIELRGDDLSEGFRVKQ
ncbi:MAG: hypothetical protein HFI60_00460 [Lachnospiraceae bacterium]|jgi:hypothetical protein|nr:hypothetical protein [Lachnospiraceae bacterium]